MPQRHRHRIGLAGALLALALTASPAIAHGPPIYGRGTASTWGGPGAARHDCIWPWDDCQPIRITNADPDSPAFGTAIVVTPIMFCACYTHRPGPNGEQRRIVDLDPEQVHALGLDPAAGLWPVIVEPVGGLPDTAMPAP